MGKRPKYLKGSRRTAAAVVALALTAAGVAGCGSKDGGEDNAVADENIPVLKRDPARETVAMTHSGYRPLEVSVPVGGTVTWVNTGTARATAENTPGAGFKFDVHTVYPGQTKTVTFTKPGKYDYFSSYDGDTFSGYVTVTRRKR